MAAVLVRDVAKHRAWADQRDVPLTVDVDAFFACDLDLLADVHRVTITQTKPVASWRGTPAEGMIDLDALVEEACFFAGSARESASTFAKSSNVTAILALSTIGLDATQVRLVADPTATAMHTSIEFKGEAGEVSVEWRGVPSAGNPSTSADVPLSVIKAIRNLSSPVWFGV